MFVVFPLPSLFIIYLNQLLNTEHFPFYLIPLPLTRSFVIFAKFGLIYATFDKEKRPRRNGFRATEIDIECVGNGAAVTVAIREKAVFYRVPLLVESNC